MADLFRWLGLSGSRPLFARNGLEDQPYSLRKTQEGYFVLHAIRIDSGEHGSYRVDRMQGAKVTSQLFAPRYAVELTSTGPSGQT